MPFIFHRLCQSTIYDSSKSFLPKADFAKQKMRYELTMETLSLTQADFRVTHLPGRPYPTPLKYPQYHRSLPRVLYRSEEGKAGSELRCRLCYRFELELDFFFEKVGPLGLGGWTGGMQPPKISLDQSFSYMQENQNHTTESVFVSQYNFPLILSFLSKKNPSHQVQPVHLVTIFFG